MEILESLNLPDDLHSMTFDLYGTYYKENQFRTKNFCNRLTASKIPALFENSL